LTSFVGPARADRLLRLPGQPEIIRPGGSALTRACITIRSGDGVRKDGMSVAVRLSRRAYEHAQQLIDKGTAVFDRRDDWSEHQPTAEQENAFIARHGYSEYGMWHLGIDDEKPADAKARYKFPYGDFETIHRCGVLSAESRAAQYKYADIEVAAAHLHGMLDREMVRVQRRPTRK